MLQERVSLDLSKHWLLRCRCFPGEHLTRGFWVFPSPEHGLSFFARGDLLVSAGSPYDFVADVVRGCLALFCRYVLLDCWSLRR